MASSIIVKSDVPSGRKGEKYSAVLAASGGIPKYHWSVDEASLPDGLRLHPNGTLSGAPTTEGNAALSVTVSDSGTPPTTQEAIVGIEILPAIRQLTRWDHVGTWLAMLAGVLPLSGLCRSSSTPQRNQQNVLTALPSACFPPSRPS